MNWPDLIRAVATLLWPVAVITLFISYRRQFISLAKYIEKLRLKIGQNEAELSLRAQLQELHEKVEATEPQPETSSATEESDESSDAGPIRPIDDVQPIVTRVINLAARNPRLALIELGAELETYVTLVLSEVGLLDRASHRQISLKQSVEVLGARVSGSAASSVDLFRTVRNQIVHGSGAGKVSDQDVLAAPDSGLILLRSLSVIPRENHYVKHANVDIFRNPECEIEITDAKGLILRSLSSGGTHEIIRIFPTTRNWYREGVQVSWERDGTQTWGSRWYRDPDSKDLLPAWSSSAEFVGRPLSSRY